MGAGLRTGSTDRKIGKRANRAARQPFCHNDDTRIAIWIIVCGTSDETLPRSEWQPDIAGKVQRPLRRLAGGDVEHQQVGEPPLGLVGTLNNFAVLKNLT